MQIKRYEASGIQEAMAKIRKDLGHDAVVLSTKRVRRGKVALIEVTAARDTSHDDLPQPSAVKAAGAGGQERTTVTDQKKVALPEETTIRTEIDEIKKMIAELKRENAVKTDLIELKETVHTLFDLVGQMKSEQGCFPSIYHSLLARGISRDSAYRMVNAVKASYRETEPGDSGEILKGVETLMGKSLAVSERRGTDKRAMAFIGPTGVGKTTTLAKLAAYYALEEKKKVGLIATDTYRIAAAEQLRVYARIMGLPIEVASEKEGFRKAYRKFADMDLVLIDTPGRNQSDEPHLHKMGDILAQAEGVDTCLLLSLTSSRENLLDAAAKFSRIPYDSIIFTKIDECASCGAMYDVIEQTSKPVQYITNGQNVPKDIMKVTPGRIAGLIMGNQFN